MNLLLKIDFDRDGDYDEDFEDVSAHIRRVTFKRGRESSFKLFSPIASLNLAATLNDLDGEYSLRKPNSDLNLARVIGAQFQLVAEFEDEDVVLATGYVNDFHPTRGINQPPSVTMSGIGILGRIREYPVSLEVAKNITITEAIRRVLQALQIHRSQYSLDEENQIITYWGVRETTARNELIRLEASSDGIIREDRNNNIVFEERTNRSSGSTVATFTDRDNLPDAIKYTNIEVIRRLDNVRNVFRVSLRSYEEEDDYSLIWSLTSSGRLPLLQNAPFDFSVEFPNANTANEYVGIAEWVTPVLGSDVIVENEAGDLVTLDEGTDISITERTSTFGRYEFVIENNGSEPLYINTLNVRGKRVSSLLGGYIVSEDRVSQGRYGTRVFKNESAVYVEDVEFATNWARFSLANYKDPFDNFKVRFYQTKNSDNNVLKTLFKREVSDKVLIVTGDKTNLYANENCYIESVQFEYDRNGRVAATFELSVGSVSGAFWILGTSELGIDTRLGY